jgi:hypothetical protein
MLGGGEDVVTVFRENDENESFKFSKYVDH